MNALHLKISLARSAGFCFGVKRAIALALDLAQKSRPHIFMLGDIVHNEEVVKKISLAGIKKIKRLKPCRDGILLVRAHGAALATLKKAASLGYRIADATCPMVKEIHRIVQAMEKQGRRVIVIGDKKHDEVLGIIGQLQSQALVIEADGPLPDRQASLPLAALKKIKKAGIVTQSTQNLHKVETIVARIKKLIPDADFVNTICRPTRLKQEEIRKMPLTNDIMLIIGSRSSANTRRLYEISRQLNRRTYWISSKQELQKQWFKGMTSAGITAGASTPDETTQEVIETVKKLG